MSSYTQAAVVYKIVQNLWDNRKQAEMLQAMYAGPSLPKPTHASARHSTAIPLVHARKPAVDIDLARIEAVVSFNAFMPMSVSKPNLESKGKAGVDVEGGTAVYYWPSLINHACLPNAHRFFFGDIMVIRASQTISRDEEITLEYKPGWEPLEKRQTFRQWGFNCACALCLADRVDGSEACSLRARLIKENDALRLTIRQAKDFVSRVMATYKDSPERSRCGTKPELCVAYRSLGHAYGEKAKMNLDLAKQLIEVEMSCLAAVGLVITDRSMNGPVRKKSTKSLPVDTKQGPTHHREYCVLASMKIAKFFDVMGDERRARDWMRVILWRTFMLYIFLTVCLTDTYSF